MTCPDYIGKGLKKRPRVPFKTTGFRHLSLSLDHVHY